MNLSLPPSLSPSLCFIYFKEKRPLRSRLNVDSSSLFPLLINSSLVQLFSSE
jgi:hypothetical protein